MSTASSRAFAPLSPPWRWAAALGASLALHAVALQFFLQPMSRVPSYADGGVLRATLRSAASPVEPQQRDRPAGLPGAPSKTRFSPTAKGGDDLTLDMGLFPAPIYYPASLLDQKPLITVHVEPRFPPGVGVETGRVLLRLYIDEKGKVNEISIEAAEPPGVFEVSAVEAFAAAKFIPGMKDGAPVKSLITLEVLFGTPPPIETTADTQRLRPAEKPRPRPPRHTRTN